MPKIIEAIYEDGVFKPLKKVELKEGGKFKVLIEKRVSKKFYEILERLEKEAPKVEDSWRVLEESRK
ncbi:MAG: antitoxin family protein [Archaeoglobaceae archaeon]